MDIVCNANKYNITHFLEQLGSTLDMYLSKYDNILLLGDFNSECTESSMEEFCDTYNVKKLINEPTCFKNPLNPSSIDVILTNRGRSFQESKVIETGLSDHHKLTVTVLKQYFPKQKPTIIKYRDYKKFDHSHFRAELTKKLADIQYDPGNYERFESTFITLLNEHAPIKEKYVRANNAPFMNKILSKAVMTRSRLRNRYLKNPNVTNHNAYRKHRNFCVRLFKKEKKSYYENLDTNKFTNNNSFWKEIKPLFSDKQLSCRKITLVEDEEIISKDIEIAEIMNTYFSEIVKNLDIEGYKVNNDHDFISNDFISNILFKYKDHPSILKIKEYVIYEEKFNFCSKNDSEIVTEINSLNANKPTTFNNIPTKILVDTCDISSPFITKIYNNSILQTKFPLGLKLADVTPVHKKDDRTDKINYRPISILPAISKIFERFMYEQISTYIGKHLSPYLCGFRKGHSTQHCLSVMLERWKSALDKNKIAGALLTDLSKAFDCLNHELLIAKLDAYGFSHTALAFLYSYLSDRKQRTKINNTLSSWSNITTGVPQGSILGPLLFNVYINDIFYFVNGNIANYADDNTPYAIEKNVDSLIQILENNALELRTWFHDNYLKMNSNKCKLLVTNHSDGICMNIDNKLIFASTSVNLLGITIDNKLSFNEHVSKLCKKTSLKLHALSRISNYLSCNKLRVTMKAFIESQFGYCPLIWMFHSRTLNNRINRLHKRALQLVYKCPTLTFEELLVKDNSFTIHDRNLQRLAIEMYKIVNNLSPDIMKEIFPMSLNPYNLRNKNPFLTHNVHSVYHGTETIAYRGPKTWTLVPEEIKQSQSLSKFIFRIRNWKPEGCSCRICRIYISNLGFIN